MKRAFFAIRSVLAYFTILPAGRFSAGPAPQTDALSYLPLIGTLIGGVAGGAAFGLSFIVPHSLVVAAAFTLPILLTGAIHFDGFLDSCDALFASTTPSRRLEIFKDPRHGTFAVVGMALLCVVWIAALWPVPSWKYPALLALTGGVSRLGAILNARDIPHARSGAIAAGPHNRLAPGVLVASALLLFGISIFVWRWAWFVLLLVVLCERYGAIRIARALDGGLVGDAYGFLIVSSEVLMLAVLGGYA